MRLLLLLFMLIAFPAAGEAQVIRGAQVNQAEIMTTLAPIAGNLDLDVNRIIMNDAGLPGILYKSTGTVAFLINGPNLSLRPRDVTGTAAMQFTTSSGGVFVFEPSQGVIIRPNPGGSVAIQDTLFTFNALAVDAAGNVQFGKPAGSILYSIPDGGARLGFPSARFGSVHLRDLSAPKTIAATQIGEFWMSDSAPPSGQVTGALHYYDGASWIPTGPFGANYHHVEDLTSSTTTSGTFQNKLTLTTKSLPGGNYRLGWSYAWCYDDNTDNFEGEVDHVTAATRLMLHIQEPKDSGGTPDGDGGIAGCGTDQVYRHSGFRRLTAISGVHVFDLNWASGGGDTAGIRDANFEFWRVP